MSKKLLNEKGFSLAEVMIAAGISGVVALGSMKIAENSQKGMRNLSTKAGKENYLNFKVKNILSDSDVCRDAFDTNNDEVGDLITLAVGASDNIDNIVIPGAAPVTKLLAVGEAMTGTNGEYIVESMVMTRTTENACEISVELDRAQGGNRLGGKDKREEIFLGCTFNLGNEMTECSSRGSSEIGKWTYDVGGGGTEYLENGFSNAVLGVYGAGDPPARLTIRADAAGTNDWNATLKDGIALPQDYIIRWGDETANDNGVAINGNADCVSFKSGASASHLTSCQGAAGTTLGPSLTVNGDVDAVNVNASGNVAAIDVNASGNVAAVDVNASGNVTAADITASGNLSVTGTSTLTGNVVMGGDARIDGVLTGPTGSGGKVQVSNGLDVAGTLGVTGKTTLTDLDINGVLNTNGGSTFNDVASFQSSTYFNNSIDQAPGMTANLQTVYANSYLYYSDRRLKENIESLSEGDLAALMELKPVSYYWKNKNVGAQREMGLIAQEVEKVFPDLVHDSKDGLKTVNYGGLISPLIGAVQELKTENERLKRENEEIKARLNRIERALAERE